LASISDEPLLRVRKLYCRFEDFRQAVIDMAAPGGRFKREVREDPSLFFDRCIVENGQRLKEGLIKIEGGKDKVLKKYVFRMGEGRKIVYRVIRLKGRPSKVSYHSISGRSRLYWRRSNERENLEEWKEGRLYGAVSENSFKILAKWEIIPDFLIPNLEVETPLEAKHIRRLERFIVEKHMKRGWEEAFNKPGVHIEANGIFLRLHFEAAEKKVLSEIEEASGILQTIQVRGILGVIARLEPDFNLMWRVKEWPRGILRGRLNLRGLKVLSELGMLGPETKLTFNPIVKPRSKPEKKAGQTAEARPSIIEEQTGGE